MTKPKHTYLDLDVVNNNLNSSVAAPQLRFEEVRNSPFLEGDSSEYFCSIVRFSIQTGNSLPIFIPRIETGQADINKTVYKVTLWFLDVTTQITYTATVSLRYIPSDATASLAQPPTMIQDMSGTYYYQYCIKEIVTMFNKGLSEAWLILLHALPTVSATTKLQEKFAETLVPFFEYDYDKCRLVLNVDESFVAGSYANGTATDGRYRGAVYFNTRFYELLSGLSCFRQNRDGYLNYLFMPDTSSTRTIKASTGVIHTMYQTVQEMSSLAMWNPIASVVFCTGMLPIISTNTSIPITYGETQVDSLASNGNNSNLTNIVSDFEIPVSETNQYRPVIVYNPSAEYRLMDMNASINLNKIDISVFWKTQYGEYIPLRLQQGCATHIKIRFRHKTFYLGY